MDVKSKLQELKQRKFGDDFVKGDLFESFSGKVSDQLLYVTEAMRPVDRSYTENTYVQCQRVQDQLRTHISSKHSTISFEYQGSVPLNMHIKRHSDVDILIATGRYHWVTPPLAPTSPYLGDAKHDLLELRADIASTIESVFPAVDLDNTGGKSIAISGGSLNRKMDLVPISWVYNTNSVGNSELTNRGIKLYDKKASLYVENYPFLHIYRCDSKDSYVNGKYRKLVRYIKNVRKDSNMNIQISSYDATALLYHLDNAELLATINDPARLSALAESFLLKVINDTDFQKTARVPNETRLLFGDGGLQLKEVIKLYDEIRTINYGILSSYLSIDSFKKHSFDDYFQKA